METNKTKQKYNKEITYLSKSTLDEKEKKKQAVSIKGDEKQSQIF